MLEEEDYRVTKRGKTRHWVKRREEKGCFNNIVIRELMIAAAERLTVTLRFLATGVSSFVFRERRFHSSRVFNGCFAPCFLFAERLLVLSLESD